MPRTSGAVWGHSTILRRRCSPPEGWTGIHAEGALEALICRTGRPPWRACSSPAVTIGGSMGPARAPWWRLEVPWQARTSHGEILTPIEGEAGGFGPSGAFPRKTRESSGLARE